MPDETSLRVDRKNHWIHVYSGGAVTVKRLHRKRGCEAIDDIGIIPRYGGVVVHDCWASYLSYDHCGHALCGSHLLRELQFVVDSNQYPWASNMKRLLQQACAKVSASDDKRLTEQECRNLRKRYRNILTRGARELPPIPARPKGRRGRIAKSDAHNLWERLKKHEQAVLLFAKEPSVPFTNNRAERDPAHEQGETESVGLLPHRAICPSLLPYLQLPANHAKPRIQSTRRHPDRSFRGDLRARGVSSYHLENATLEDLQSYMNREKKLEKLAKSRGYI